MKKFLSWLNSTPKSKRGPGTIAYKCYVPPITGTSYDRKLKQNRIKTEPASYLLTIEIKGQLKTIEVKKELFFSKSKGDDILVEYMIGKKGLCIKEVIQ